MLMELRRRGIISPATRRELAIHDFEALRRGWPAFSSNYLLARRPDVRMPASTADTFPERRALPRLPTRDAPAEGSRFLQRIRSRYHDVNPAMTSTA